MADWQIYFFRIFEHSFRLVEEYRLKIIKYTVWAHARAPALHLWHNVFTSVSFSSVRATFVSRNALEKTLRVLRASGRSFDKRNWSESSRGRSSEQYFISFRIYIYMYIYIFHNHNKYRNSFRLRKTKKKCKKINNTKREYIQKTRMKNIAASTNVILFTFLLRDQKTFTKKRLSTNRSISNDS